MLMRHPRLSVARQYSGLFMDNRESMILKDEEVICRMLVVG